MLCEFVKDVLLALGQITDVWLETFSVGGKQFGVQLTEGVKAIVEPT